MDLYHKYIFDPITKGTLYHDDLHSSIGAKMFAVCKSHPTATRPVINTDTDQIIASANLCNTVYRTPEVLDYFENSNPRISQRGISKDGCLWVAKEIQ